ncbi:phosphatase PAP2 family protein [Vibrio parahaemolyticus]|nr:PAP2 family protein [Vibrio parahaemolyticus]OQU03988.1 phosphatase PAP2 family protein [Vibrio parahaemolyticus]OUJ29057.1 phosphatase PAP2 family protein [Vibrio parahaemolyticus]TBT61574.1 phosphatase PAP2 family protein [Vibrio parahaemolyticus]TNY67625.1 phosphatase PAP2 family protein [Vibrio parahaemolyticus]
MVVLMKKTIRVVGVASLLCCQSVNAMSEKDWDVLTDIGTYGLVATAAAVPVYKGDWEGFWQAGLSIGTASGVGLIGKKTIDEERPDKSDNDSFPSNHTANAFASATNLYLRYGWEAGLPAYSMAALVGVGRVEAKKHYWRDVLAGAALGTLSAYIFTDAYDENVQLVPWVTSEDAGISITYRW